MTFSEIIKNKNVQLAAAFLSGAVLVYLTSSKWLKNKYAYCLEYPEIYVNPNNIMWDDKKAKVSFRLNGKEVDKVVSFSDAPTSVVDGKYTIITDLNATGNGTYIGIKNNKDGEIEDTLILDWDKK